MAILYRHHSIYYVIFSLPDSPLADWLSIDNFNISVAANIYVLFFSYFIISGAIITILRIEVNVKVNRTSGPKAFENWFWNDNQTCTLTVVVVYMMTQQRRERVSPTTSLVLPAKRGTLAALGARLSGFSCTGMSAFDTSDSEFMLWLFVDVRLLSTGLPFVRI